MSDKPSRFWSKVGTGNGCWEWLAAVNEHGYGRIRWEGRSQKAHRVAWMLWEGPIPAHLDVLHICDNPRCVRPAHLYLGTHADNMRDMFTRNRRKASENKNNAWKLSAAQVHEIRARYAAGDTSYRSLAKEFGVTNQYIGQLVRFEAWNYRPVSATGENA
jgi:hypothetical protein